MTDRWFTSGDPLGWRKKDSAEKRRRTALRARGGDALAAGRALLSLSNVNSGRKGDKETHDKALADARYFFRLHKNQRSSKR